MRVSRTRGRKRVSGSRDLVRFRLAQGVYAVPVAEVVAIVRPLPVVATPAATAQWPGVANHRGSVVSIVNLRALFSLEPTASGQRCQWIVVRTPTSVLALVVDAVVDVASSHEHRAVDEHIVRAETLNAPITSVLLDGEQMVFVLDPQRVAPRTALAVLDAV